MTPRSVACRGLAAAGAGLALACAGAPPAAAPQALAPASAALALPPIPRGGGRPARLLLVGVSGLEARHYLGPAGGPPPMELLGRLAAAGAAAEAVDPVAPACVYPASASLVTGRLPAQHGIVADLRIGTRGVRSARYSQASQLRAPTLWQRASEAGLRVASLGWPSTEGAALPLLVPDSEAAGPGGHWLDAAAEAAAPELVPALRAAAGALPPEALDAAGEARDRVLVDVACAAIERSQATSVLLLELSGLAAAAERAGPASAEAQRAAAVADGELARLLTCSGRSVPLAATAVIVAGDRALAAVHTRVAPNAVLARAGLLDPATGWQALVRSNGGSAFVYAASERAALRARDELAAEAQRTRAFRVVRAEELLPLGVDPDAWFGLQAEAGYVFSDAADAALLAPAELRGGGGYLPGGGPGTGFVAWGRGIRGGLRVPHMRQTDVGPTAAALLGLELARESELDGRALIGVLDLPPAKPR